MDRVIKLFLETALEFVKELGDASASGDAVRLQRASHSLKPCSATVGASVLSAHCGDLKPWHGRDWYRMQLLESASSKRIIGRWHAL
jgi:HPt (histidine-containing phosphotransfer) domain-containing protein